jgi:hypothetical protein
MSPDAQQNMPTLAEYAGLIIESWRDADSSRLRTGRLLLQAREIFEAGKAEGDSWRAWCTKNIVPPRSYRDIKRVMALARDPDPIAAVAKAKEAARTGMAAKRARDAAKRGANVSPPGDNVVPLTPRAEIEEQSAADGGGEDMPTQPEIIAPRDNQCDNPEKERGPRIQRGKNNKVRTNGNFALDIVKHFSDQFKEDDSFIDPCCGDGAFFDAICAVADGEIQWCEIDRACIPGGSEPRDFLTHDEHMDWAITNTPWSADEYAPIFRHALEIADNIVFLIRVQNATTTARRNEWEAAGFGLKEIAICRWQDAGFPPEGLPLAALHWQRGYTGDTRNSKIIPEPIVPAIRDIEAEVAELGDSTKGKLAAILDRIIHPTTTTFDMVRSKEAFLKLSRKLLPSQIWPLREGRTLAPIEAGAPADTPEPGTPEYADWTERQEKRTEDILRDGYDAIFSNCKLSLDVLDNCMSNFTLEQREELRTILESMALREDEDELFDAAD